MVDNTNQNTDVSDQVETDDNTQEKPISAEQFNKAMSARERSFEKKLQKQQDEFKSILERLASPVKEEKELSRTAELERTVKELSKNIQDRDSRDKANNLRRATEQALRAHGIDAEFSEHALAYLIDAKQAVKYDSDGEITMVVNGIAYDNLDDGVAAWSQSRDAKLYKKPTLTNGSGDGNRQGSRQTLADIKNKGSIDLKRKEGWEDKFDVHSPKLALDRDSKIALNDMLKYKFSQRNSK